MSLATCTEILDTPNMVHTVNHVTEKYYRYSEYGLCGKSCHGLRVRNETSKYGLVLSNKQLVLSNSGAIKQMVGGMLYHHHQILHHHHYKMLYHLDTPLPKHMMLMLVVL